MIGRSGKIITIPESDNIIRCSYKWEGKYVSDFSDGVLTLLEYLVKKKPIELNYYYCSCIPYGFDDNDCSILNIEQYYQNNFNESFSAPKIDNYFIPGIGAIMCLLDYFCIEYEKMDNFDSFADNKQIESICRTFLKISGKKYLSYFTKK